MNPILQEKQGGGIFLRKLWHNKLKKGGAKTRFVNNQCIVRACKGEFQGFRLLFVKDGLRDLEIINIPF